MSNLVLLDGGYKIIVFNSFSWVRLKCIGVAGTPMPTQWNTSQKMKIWIKLLFPLYTEITLKSDYYFISTFLPQKKKKKISVLLYKTAFNLV